MPEALTDRQTDVLRFVRSYMRRHRMPPTIQEIADAFGLSSANAVVKHLRALEKKGYLEREPNQARGLRLVEDVGFRTPAKGDVPHLPVLGPVSSAQPERLRERPAAFLAVDPYFLRDARLPEKCLIGRAGDDGMRAEGIHRGDLLVIEEQEAEELSAEQPCGVLLDKRLVTRHASIRQGHVSLRAAGGAEKTFLAGDPGCHVIGRVLGVLRRR